MRTGTVISGGRMVAVSFAFALAAICMSGCATTIPSTDTTPPELRLVISGPGIGRHEMTNPPRSSWTGPSGAQLFDLLPNTEYNYVLTVSDRGGAARANLRMPDNFTVVELNPSDATQGTTTLEITLTLRGSRSDPRTALVIAGKFRTPDLPSGEVLVFDFNVEGDDFGGASGSPNQRFMSVSSSINAFPR